MCFGRPVLLYLLASALPQAHYTDSPTYVGLHAVNAPAEDLPLVTGSDPLAGFKPGSSMRQGSGSTLASPPSRPLYPNTGAHLRPPAGFQGPHGPPGQSIPQGYPPRHIPPPGPPGMRPPAPGHSSHSGHASSSGYGRGFSPGPPLHRQTGATKPLGRRSNAMQ